ncbi:transcriptional regulator, AraC family [Chryseobacterium soldanellicola]|uniref:Transcriptional regulator, AraC family n=1 Tax=Chryseobacterium soldanellicola TaxID=311333 RepID=A0A1H1GA27_9FLAO|nr:helix-turn-helix domain-containing protein [Chryseobacterium soldanellicola]SDR10017.1 transcriptional regulator, AraC family [Chryseobacterium soldanellicola]
MKPVKNIHQEFEAPQELRDIIKCFWYNDTDFGEADTSFEVIPDGYAEIIFHFGSGCSIFHNGVLQPLPSPFLVGLLNHPVHFHTKKRLQIIAVRCFPWTVFDLLGLDSNKNGVHIFEHPIAKLQSSLQDLINNGKIEEAIHNVKEYFLNAQISTKTMLYKAGIAMRKANGTITVHQVADAAHATVRTLERKFKQSSGHTVKDVSSLMRFEKVRNQLWINPDTNLAGLAVELGYTDQAHLSREFKRYTGTTPAAFARKAKKEQIIDTDFVAFIQS